MLQPWRETAYAPCESIAEASVGEPELVSAIEAALNQ
jgi:hypothetical protein